MIQIKDVTKLYPAQAAKGPTLLKEGRNGAPQRTRYMRWITFLCTLRRANGFRSWGLQDLASQRLSI
jgi:hypothetical protein